jgi:hypothetical protein
MKGLTLGALLLLAIVVGAYRFQLAARARALRQKTQARRLREIRDRLQRLGEEGRIETSSPVYDFLMTSSKLAIPSARSLRLGDLVAVARTLHRRMEAYPSNLADECRKQPAEVQLLVADLFKCIADLLVDHDWVVRAMFRMSGLGNALGRLASFLGGSIRNEAVSRAREFRKLGEALPIAA